MRTFLTILCLSALTLRAELIPADRLITWDAGVRGGVPAVTTMFCDVTVSIPGTNRLAVADGATDDYIAVQTALNLCPSNQYVYLPAGQYRITNGLSITTSGVVLRGAGTNTLLRFAGTYGYAGLSVGNNSGTTASTAWTYGYTKGATNIGVGSASGLSVGTVIAIATTNNVVWPATNSANEWIVSSVNNTPGESSHCGYDSGHYSSGQLVEIQAIDGTNLTILPPLHFWYTNGNEKVYRFGAFVDRVGIENLTCIPYSASEYSSHLIGIYETKNCWVTNVWLRNASYSHLWLSKSLWATVRHNWLEGQLDNTYSSNAGYGLTTYLYTTASLLDDNVITRCMNSSVIQTSSGNVIAYNFATNNIGPGTPPYTRMTFGHGNHGAHPKMNLFEGNKENGYFDDYIHGSSGPETLLRNYFRGWATNTVIGVSTSETRYAVCAIQLAWWNRHASIVGNVMGVEGLTTWGGSDYQHTTDVNGNEDFADPSIYRFGYYNSANGDTNYDAQVLSTVIRKGNAVATNGGNWAITANEALGGDTVPDSYYLASKPAWFGSLSWPAIGSDLTPKVGTIPAEARFLGEGYAPPAAPGPAYVSTLRAGTIHAGVATSPPAAPPAATYLVQQGFEGTGYGHTESWTESGDGTIDEDYTGTVLAGSQSLELVGNGAQAPYARVSHTANGEVWVYCLWRPVSQTGTASFLRIRDGSGTLAHVERYSSGVLVCTHGGAGSSATADAASLGTTYHVWVRYQKGTGGNGAMSVEFSTDGTKVGSGNKFTSLANGTSTADASVLQLGPLFDTTLDHVFDQVRVDDEAIGSNPE